MSDHVSFGGDPIVLVGGGIGAGKSSVLKIFEDHGFAVISTDDVGRDLLAPGSTIVEMVRGLWPEVVVGSTVDRELLAGIVFDDPSELLRLEEITHPAIEERVRFQIAQCRTPVAIEVPLMKVFREDRFSRVAVVAAREVRMARAIARGSTGEDVRRRMANQPTQDQWRDWADVVVDNSGAWARTEAIVRSLITDISADV